jgi:hypothetical protein
MEEGLSAACVKEVLGILRIYDDGTWTGGGFRAKLAVEPPVEPRTAKREAVAPDGWCAVGRESEPKCATIRGVDESGDDPRRLFLDPEFALELKVSEWIAFRGLVEPKNEFRDIPLQDCPRSFERNLGQARQHNHQGSGSNHGPFILSMHLSP